MEVINALSLKPTQVAILGPGGIGKTALAVTVLHHPDIVSKYAHRHFVSCAGATTAGQLVSNVAVYLGLEPSQNPSKIIVQYLMECGPTLLVLDNLETAWEAKENRYEVEEFLSILSEVDELTLLITLRGAERPGKVKWHRPFLAPLEPLHPTASRQTFIEIANLPTSEEGPDFAEILELTGHLPLAISLMASVSASEGYSSSLSRWKAECTSLVSQGYEKESNLEKSIMISLTSPRMTERTGNLELLSILSVLPDGLCEADLTVLNIPIGSILECKSVLLQTSLAYLDCDGRLQALSPIREYIQRFQPPEGHLLAPIEQHWCDLLTLWCSYQQLDSKNLGSQLNANMGNIISLISYRLKTEGSLCPETLHSIIDLADFSRTMLKSDSILLPLIPEYINVLNDSWIQLRYLMLRLAGSGPPLLSNEADIAIAESMKNGFSDLDEGRQSETAGSCFNQMLMSP
ncbi:P-loop containing nucleoside triphosphate hydrolase protein [Mycena rebaudengoi]|nr:P-loop containing nucleoside triphosphate hydrolase protein [Mycena rebaudengoi]